eukprot:3145862-Rhodomonas_salina.3
MNSNAANTYAMSGTDTGLSPPGAKSGEGRMVVATSQKAKRQGGSQRHAIRHAKSGAETEHRN